jgi:hypothetical protein
MTKECSGIDSIQLETDIQMAKRHRVSVLITAPLDHATAIVRAIAEHNSPGRAAEIVTCDSAVGHDVATAIAEGWRCIGMDRDAIVWLKEVHVLKPAEQAVTMDLLAGPSRRTDRALRVIASSTVDLFGLVRAGAFDPSLFYRLNTIHIVFPPEKAAES